MRVIIFGFLLLIIGCKVKHSTFYQTNQVQLTSPKVTVSQTFFEEETVIYFDQTEKGTKIYSVTDEKRDQFMNDSLIVKETQSYQFYSCGAGFTTSDTIPINVFKVDSKRIRKVKHSTPSDHYPGTTRCLNDQKKGSINFRDGNWMGFDQGEFSYSVELEKGQKVDGIVVSSLRDYGSWIFCPAKIIVALTDQNGVLHSFEETYAESNAQDARNGFEFSRIRINEMAPAKIKITVFPPAKIPEWHPGKGTTPWLFIDEIVLL